MTGFFKFIVPLVLVFLTSPVTVLAKVPILHSTDLLHPHDDPDDHYDLACLFALQEFDIKGIILDLGERQAQRSGGRAVEQMMHISGQKVPYGIGLSKKLRQHDDKVLDDDTKFQAGVQLLLSTLRGSQEKVTIHTAGSCRDVAAAFNREPALFKEKVKALYLDIGDGPNGEQREWNVTLDPIAYVRLLESGLPLYWCPCHGKDGYLTQYTANQAVVVGACVPSVQKFFTYCLAKSKEDPIAFLTSGPQGLPTGNRNMWCTAALLHAAGRNIYQRGNDDFVALAPFFAEKAGLSGKSVEAFQFHPVRVVVEPNSRVVPAGKKEIWPRLNVEACPEGATSFRFRATDSRYERIMASVLKNLLAELGR